MLEPKSGKIVREQYDQIADGIGGDEEFYAKVMALGPEEKSEISILDIGSGKGLLMKEIKTKYPRSTIYGVDFSKELLSRSRCVKGTNCIMADALNIPIAENSIDVAFCTEVIEHLQDPMQLLKEIRFLLKPEGRLVMTFPNRLAYYPAYAFLRKIPANMQKKVFQNMHTHAQRVVYWFIPTDDPALTWQPIDHTYASTEVLSWLQETGYEITNYTGYSYLKNLRVNKIKEFFGQLLSPIFAYRFFVVTRPT